MNDKVQDTSNVSSMENTPKVGLSSAGTIENENELPEWEDLIEDQGGVGRFQILSFLLIELQINSDSWLIYGMSYFTKYPQFKDCVHNGKPVDPNSDDFISFCTPKYFCGKSPDVISWKIYETSNITLDNWIKDFDFMCLSSFEIGFFISVWFLG